MSVRGIIGAALALACALLLGGCSVLRIGYGQAPLVLYWWIDGYADLTEPQSQALREGIDRWFDWHRRQEMPRYAELLARAQRDVMEPRLTPERLCAWRDEVQRRSDAALEQAAPALGALMVTLSPQQVQHVQRQLAKNLDELRSKIAPPDRTERAQGAFKRTLERYENLYGRLDDAQRARLAALLAASPFDADRWLAEREARNRDIVATLSAVAAAARQGGERGAVQAQAQAAVLTMGQRVMASPRPEYRAYQERLAQDGCAQAATMHNLMSAAQRQAARDKLRGWENDVRLLAANGNGNGAARPGPDAVNPR